MKLSFGGIIDRLQVQWTMDNGQQGAGLILWWLAENK